MKDDVITAGRFLEKEWHRNKLLTTSYSLAGKFVLRR